MWSKMAAGQPPSPPSPTRPWPSRPRVRCRRRLRALRDGRSGLFLTRGGASLEDLSAAPPSRVRLFVVAGRGESQGLCPVRRSGKWAGAFTGRGHRKNRLGARPLARRILVISHRHSRPRRNSSLGRKCKRLHHRLRRKRRGRLGPRWRDWPGDAFSHLGRWQALSAERGSKPDVLQRRRRPQAPLGVQKKP